MVMRIHEGHDLWGKDRYSIPSCAVVGASDTGTGYKSMANSFEVEKELERFRRDMLVAIGVHSKVTFTVSAGAPRRIKRWVIVSESRHIAATEFACGWLVKHEKDTKHVHDAL